MIRTTSAGSASDLQWFKSSYSDSSDGNDCVEVATAAHTIRVRDSKAIPGPQLGFAPTTWATFVTYASRD